MLQFTMEIVLSLLLTCSTWYSIRSVKCTVVVGHLGWKQSCEMGSPDKSPAVRRQSGGPSVRQQSSSRLWRSATDVLGARKNSAQDGAI